MRCIERFKKLATCEDNKLFIIGFFNLEAITEERKVELYRFNKAFSEYAKNYTLLVILHKTGPELKHTLSSIDNIYILEITTQTTSNGILFKERRDNDYLHFLIQAIFKFDLKPIL